MTERFTGKPRYQSTVRHKRRARMLNGKLVRPESGIDMLLIGVIEKAK